MKPLAFVTIITLAFLSTLPLASQSIATTYPAHIVTVDESGGVLTMRGVRTTEGELETLRLRAVAPAVSERTEIIVMTATGEKRVTAPETRAYIGTIDGDPRSTVTVVHAGAKTYGIISEGSGATWVLSRTVGTPSYTIARGDALPREFECVGFDEDEAMALPPTIVAGAPMREMEVAVETDTRFFLSTGGTEEDAVAYLSALMSSVSAIYQRDLGLVVTMTWARIWTLENSDPYGANGDPYLLTDLVAQNWSAYADVERDILHVITTDDIGQGGWGYYSKICQGDQYAHSTSSINGYHDPLAPVFNYDTYTVAHELGHNLGARHTHSCFYGAPLDTCHVEQAIAEGCLSPDQVRLPNPGSIMSYCGHANNDAGLGYQVAMYFPEPVAGPMRTYIESLPCLSLYALPIPTPIAPVDDTVAVGAVDFSWSAAWSGAYEVELRGAEVRTIRVNESDTTIMIESMGGVEWRVRSIADGSVGEWSEWRSFLIGDETMGVEDMPWHAPTLDLW